MSVETKTDAVAGKFFITVSGRFDFGLHQQFRDATNSIGPNIKEIEVDLSRTDYLDSSALGMLLVLRDKVGQQRSSVSIKNAKPEVKKILEIANFNKLFTMA